MIKYNVLENVNERVRTVIGHHNNKRVRPQ